MSLTSSSISQMLSVKVTSVTLVDSILIALIGMAIVFAILILLMVLISAFGWIMQNSPKFAAKYPQAGIKIAKFKTTVKSIGKKKSVEADAIAEVEGVVASPLASGTCGELTLVMTSERDAAMIMAIIADATKTPLNELRFISIKNLSEGETK